MSRDLPCVQAGLKKSQLNVLSSCEETDAMENLSPLRSGGRKKKVQLEEDGDTVQVAMNEDEIDVDDDL